ncbi:hypothetical protein HPB51_022825 [Rhipicephalus microplus]|uniref:RNA-dependent RNA polymerase n=1 Tax=Rhipicephalus microplus TaxID=6941 RepID=A0A9J6DCJ2_RHIMP|nr:hypothetical protein HPB51_022825 [Rhipicephalus microplus]
MHAADERQNSAVTIRQWMGKFEGIPNVAKRMGQCFSSTEQPVRVKPCDVQKEPDIIAGGHPFSRRPYIFSDGVGMMSVQLAEEVSRSAPQHIRVAALTMFKDCFSKLGPPIHLGCRPAGQCIFAPCSRADQFQGDLAWSSRACSLKSSGR